MRTTCLKRMYMMNEIGGDLVADMDPDTEPPKPKCKKTKRQSSQWGFGIMILSDDQYWGGNQNHNKA